MFLVNRPLIMSGLGLFGIRAETSHVCPVFLSEFVEGKGVGCFRPRLFARLDHLAAGPAGEDACTICSGKTASSAARNVEKFQLRIQKQTSFNMQPSTSTLR